MIDALFGVILAVFVGAAIGIALYARAGKI